MLEACILRRWGGLNLDRPLHESRPLPVQAKGRLFVPAERGTVRSNAPRNNSKFTTELSRSRASPFAESSGKRLLTSKKPASASPNATPLLNHKSAKTTRLLEVSACKPPAASFVAPMAPSTVIAICLVSPAVWLGQFNLSGASGFATNGT